MDKVAEIIDDVIAYTDEILNRNPELYIISRDGLTCLRETLHTGAIDHKAILKLDHYLNEIRRRFSN